MTTDIISDANNEHRTQMTLSHENLQTLSVYNTAVTAVKSTTQCEVNFTLESLKHIQKPEHLENFQIVSQRNRFRIAFSTAKMAINVTLETKSDNKLVRWLKNFISS